MIPMRRSDFNTSPNMKMVGLMIQLPIAICSTEKSVTMDRCFCVLTGIFQMRKRVLYGIALVKINAIGLGGFVDTLLVSNLVKKYWLCGIP